MRNMSFSLTTPQMERGEKDVTRRMGWKNLKAGDRLRACEKCMGLKKGEKVRVICEIEVVSVRQELLCDMVRSHEYGQEECRREGFPNMTPKEFNLMFIASHKGCNPLSIVTRIEFRKVT